MLRGYLQGNGSAAFGRSFAIEGPFDISWRWNTRVRSAVMHKESELNVWGSGTPRREFMHVDDLADGLVFLLKNYSSAKPINIGAGKDHTIAELANMICGVAGFRGEVVFDTSKPDGTMRKLMDNARMTKGGWRPKIGLEAGLRATYEWFAGAPDVRRVA